MPSSSVKDSFKDILVDLKSKVDRTAQSSASSGPTLLWHDYETWGVGEG